jgi:hypothetical protein
VLGSKSTRTRAGAQGQWLRNRRLAAELLVLAGSHAAAKPLVYVAP